MPIDLSELFGNNSDAADLDIFADRLNDRCAVLVDRHVLDL